MTETRTMPRPSNVLDTQGPIAQRLDSYEPRESQLEMADLVGFAFEEQRHLLVEAGTGTGKSYSYLIPAILQATFKKRKTIISTRTIALQEQLVTKDLPFLKEVLPYDFTYALVKGRSNYVCLRRLDLALDKKHQPAKAEDRRDVQRVKEWTKSTANGTKSDLPFIPTIGAWEAVASDSENCMGRDSPHYTECFYQRDRRAMRSADIIVVNHSLLLVDMILRMQEAMFLPEASFLVIDEAHNLEAITGEQLGLALTTGGIRRAIHRIWNPKRQRGLSTFSTKEKEIRVRAIEAERCLEENTKTLQKLRGRRDTQRIREPIAEANNLTPALFDLAETFKRSLRSGTSPEALTEIRAAIRVLQVHSAKIEDFWGQESEGFAYWIESWKASEKMRAAPIHVAPLLEEGLFGAFDSVILTSATLSTGPSGLSYIRNQLGVPNPIGKVLPSSFDFQKQVKLVLPEDMPDPRADEATFLMRVSQKIEEYIRKSGGKALVLFTSYRHLKAVREKLEPFFSEIGTSCLIQGDGAGTQELLRRFREEVDSVLMGVSTFWEGIDVPGEALSSVIIVKLPFAVPSHPLVEARDEAEKAAGRNPFFEIRVPEAAIHLRQGFGRLIRRSTDRGVVAILDPRLRTKRYGRTLLAALPDCEVLEEWPEDGD